MGSWSWRDLLTNRDRHQFPEVVVPLANAPAPKNPTTDPYAEKKSDSEADSNHTHDRASSQEKGVASSPPPPYSELTLDALRAEVEADVSSSGHDTAYDRTSPFLT